MRISFNWLNEYISTELSPQETADKLTMCGLEVELVEEYINIKGGLKGLVVGEVLSVEKHPSADRLTVCKVKVDKEIILQIVCGAPNVKAGQKVIVAKDGTTIHSLKAEPFVIRNTKIRGVESQGMICAEDEIGLGENHEGIAVLSENAKVGSAVKNYFDVYEDWIFEIGVTPNRADALSHLGVARDLGAVLGKKIKATETKNFGIDNKNAPIKIEIKNPSLCPRYAGLSITNVKVGESPKWLQEKLKAVGQFPINNLVDAANYVTHDIGQPIHVFDADTIKGNKVIIKTLGAKTKFITLDKKERIIDEDVLMICNAEEPMVIAGIFGGLHSGVSEQTKNIFIESAYFSPFSIRKSSKKLGLKTEASYRFERGTDVEMVIPAIKKVATLIQKVAGGKISSVITDMYPKKILPHKVNYNTKRMSVFIGDEIPEAKTKKILDSLDIKIKARKKDLWKLEVPSYRADVKREEGVAEEILRIYGYNKIPLAKKLSISLSHKEKTAPENLYNRMADFLCATGFYEHIANSLTRQKYADENAAEILNKLSEDLGVLRQTLLYSGLESILHNINRKSYNLKFFELGKIYSQKNGTYSESEKLALWLTGNNNVSQWYEKGKSISYFSVKGTVEQILSLCGAEKISMEEISNDAHLSFGMKNEFVKFGAVKKDILKNMDIEQEVFYGEIDWKYLMKVSGEKEISFRELPKYPSVKRDISMIISENVTYQKVTGIITKINTQLIKKVSIFDRFRSGAVGEGNKSYAVSVNFQDETRTLTDEEVDGWMKKIIRELEEKLSAKIRAN